MEGQKEHVMGSHKYGPQYQQCDENWENITIIMTVCIDGTEHFVTISCDIQSPRLPGEMETR
jgi:hypothetical protein